MTDYEQKLWLGLWGAVAGGFMSLLINLLTGVFLPRLRRWNLTRHVSIVTDPPHNGIARFRVVNGGFWTITDAMLYLHLDIQEQDVLQPPNGYQAHIAPGRFVPLPESGEQLCWSVLAPDPNPMKVAILAKERQPFSPCSILPEFVLIPSELGGWRPGSTARVFLRRRRYTGTLTLVTADTNARVFSVRIEPDSASTPCIITPK